MTFQSVQGRCPACRGNSLFVAEGGYITCSRVDCPNPDAVATLLKPGNRTEGPRPLAVGDVIHGFTYGVFGRDHYDCSRIVAAGPDWIEIGDSDGKRSGYAEGRHSLTLCQKARDEGHTTPWGDAPEPCPLGSDGPPLTTA